MRTPTREVLGCALALSLMARSATSTLQPDGKVLALADRAGAGLNPAGVVLIRVLRTDQLDSTFGSDGAVGIDLGPHASARAIALQPDGNFVVGGTDDPSGIFLVR